MLRRVLLCSVLIALALVSFVYPRDYPERFDTIRQRLANRNFPSVVQTWAGDGWRRVEGLDRLTDLQVIALHDVFFTHNFRGRGWRYNPETDFIELDKDLSPARNMIRTLHKLNPNIVILIQILLKTAPPAPGNDRYPESSHPYWIHDAAGNIVRTGSRALVDFTHPRVQEIIIQQAVYAQESGLVDGIMFDWWHDDWSITEGYRTVEGENEARLNILHGIRERTHPDFIIMGNTNDRKIPVTAEYVNAAFMETFPRGGSFYNLQNIIRLENTIRWLNDNLREPQIVCLETHTMGGLIETLINPDQVQVMRMFTTLSLTHSEGTVLHAHDRGHRHYWHDFWDADLGQPLGARYQRYNNTAGLYIREFTNGFAVYNRRDENEWIEFEIPVAGVTSERYDYIHEIPAMDGEIYLKMSMTKVAPRDLIATQWAKMKYKQR